VQEVDVMGRGSTVEQVLEETQSGRIASLMNWLRAGVMGANDGIVSTAGVVVGVAGASVSSGALLAVAVLVTAVAVVVALAATGSISAQLGGAGKPRAVARTIGGGLAAMGTTYAIGLLVGTQL
jgi:VIT1/CCC1 family predicted Fe2+/Mn2+ transporter